MRLKKLKNIFCRKPKWSFDTTTIDYEAEGWSISEIDPSWREDVYKAYVKAHNRYSYYAPLRLDGWCWLSPNKKTFVEINDSEIINKMELKKLRKLKLKKLKH